MRQISGPGNEKLSEFEIGPQHRESEKQVPDLVKGVLCRNNPPNCRERVALETSKITNASALSICPMQIMSANMVEYQSFSRDISQSTTAKVIVIG